MLSPWLGLARLHDPRRLSGIVHELVAGSKSVAVFHLDAIETVAWYLNNPNRWQNILSGSHRLERQGFEGSANSGSA